MARILIVDDEINIIKTMGSILQDEGHTIHSCENGGNAVEFLNNNQVELVILDVWLPDIDGIDLLARFKKEKPETAVIMMSGHGSIDIAVKSTKMGAFDFIVKPPSMERVITSVNNALEQVRLKLENIKLRKASAAEDDMIGSTQIMKDIMEVIETAAKTNARVLITGESGTGKELIARSIYQRSRRSDKPFVKVNCAAIPEDLIESELFGHEMGSFTGAVARRLGKFEMASNGTIFLDEICDMSLPAQAKVLRVLQEQQFERVGGNETINVDVRVISATNVDMKAAIEENRFREDLYYRLNVIPIHAPSLFERKEDIPMLVDYFMNKFSEEHGIRLKRITEEGMDLLINHSWPGNVRELKNIIERILIMVQKDSIGADDIIKYLESYDYDDIVTKDISPLKSARIDFEKNYIVQALKKNGKNIEKTARDLGIDRINLFKKMSLYGINKDKI